VYARQFTSKVIIAVAITDDGVYDMVRLKEKPDCFWGGPIKLNQFAPPADREAFAKMVGNMKEFEHGLVGCVGYLESHKSEHRPLKFVILELGGEELGILREIRKKHKYTLNHECLVAVSLYLKHFPGRRSDTAVLFGKTGLADYMVR
jgi:hypothetical protein